MANKTITNLKELETAKASDVLLIENATETLKITKQNLLKEFATEIYVQQKIAEASLSGGEVDDLKTEVDDLKTEVETARGTHDTLNARLNKVDEIQAKTNAQLFQMDIKKADKSQIGSPLTANSVAEMTDISKVYVNLSDGHWYSYNGSNWIDGGVYNSVAIGDRTIWLNHIKGGYKISNLYNCEINFIENQFIDTAGVIKPGGNCGYAKVPIPQNQKISIYKPNAIYDSSGGLGLFLDSSEEIISSFTLSDFIQGIYNGTQYVTVDSPDGCCYVCFNVKMPYYDDSTTTIVELGDKITNSNTMTQLFGYNLSDESFNEFKQSINYENNDNLYDKNIHYLNNFYISVDGSMNSATGWGCAIIPCEPSTTYSLQLPFNDYSGTIGALGYYQGDSKIDYVCPASNLINGNSNGVNYITFTTPSNCNNVRITCKRLDAFDNSDSLIFAQGVEILSKERYVKYIQSIGGYKFKCETFTGTTETHPLCGKKWAVVGDSLTEKNIRATKNYHDYVAEETGVIVYNMGRSGTGYKRTEENNTAFYQRITSIPKDTEIVTIFGSGNDLSLPLGEVTDTGTDTLCGCINTTIDNLYSVLPVVKLGIITPCPWGGYPPHVKDNKMALYSDAIIEICKSRGIPCLDLYHSSNMRPWDNTFKNLMYKRDNGNSVHPDEDGHKFMYRRFLSFIESL